MKDKINADLVTGIVFLLFGISIFILIPFQIPETASSVSITGRFAPRLISVSIIVLSIFQIIANIFFSKSNKSKAIDIPKEDIKRVILFAISFAIFISVVKVIGFFVSLTLFVIFVMKLLNVKFNLLAFLIIIGIDASIYILFDRIMHVGFPSGILF